MLLSSLHPAHSVIPPQTGSKETFRGEQYFRYFRYFKWRSWLVGQCNVREGRSGGEEWGQAADCDLIGNICGGRRRQQWQRWRSYAGIDTGGRMIGAKRWRMPPLQSDQGIITHYPSSPGQEMLPSPGQRRTCCCSYLQHPTSEPRPSIQPGHGGICCQTCKHCLTMFHNNWRGCTCTFILQESF